MNATQCCVTKTEILTLEVKFMFWNLLCLYQVMIAAGLEPPLMHVNA